MAVVRSLDAWRALERATALSTLIHQRHLTPSCRGHAPIAERTVGPARNVVESLTSKPGIREQHQPKRDISGRNLERLAREPTGHPCIHGIEQRTVQAWYIDPHFLACTY